MERRVKQPTDAPARPSFGTGGALWGRDVSKPHGCRRPSVQSDMGVPPFQRFLDEHGPAVHGFLVASVGRHEADDRFQEAFLAALRAYPRLENADNLRSWALTIAHRKAIDAHPAR